MTVAFIYGRDGKISVFRVGVAAAVVGTLLIGGSFVALLLDRSARQVPLEIPAPVEATLVEQAPMSSTARRTIYRIPEMTPEQVLAHYEQYLGSYDSELTGCTRNPTLGNFPGSDRPGRVPYEFICMFDASSLFSRQYTQVRIQPGVSNPDPALDTSGSTLVQHEQHWNP